jgi:hypothetical protein
MTFITHGFPVSVISDVRERVRDLASPLHFMLRRSSLVVCYTERVYNVQKKKISISMWNHVTVIDFSSGPVAHGQWKLIRTSDLPNFFNRIYINILILKFSGQYIRKSNFEDWCEENPRYTFLTIKSSLRSHINQLTILWL